MSSLTALKDRVRFQLAVGSTLDSQLDFFVMDAIREFETRIELDYMRHLFTGTLGPGRSVALGVVPKRLLWVQVQVNDQWLSVELLRQWHAVRAGRGTPTACWLEGQELVFDNEPASALPVRAEMFRRTTSFPPDGHPLWTTYQAHLLARTVFEAGLACRKPELAAEAGQRFDSMMMALQIEADGQLEGSAEYWMGGLAP